MPYNKNPSNKNSPLRKEDGCRRFPFKSILQSLRKSTSICTREAMKAPRRILDGELVLLRTVGEG